jgi:hypothetical protein
VQFTDVFVRPVKDLREREKSLWASRRVSIQLKYKPQKRNSFNSFNKHTCKGSKKTGFCTSSLRNLLRTIKGKLPSVQRASPEEIAFVDVEIALSITQEEEIKDLLKQQYLNATKECQRALDKYMERENLPKIEYTSSDDDDFIESESDIDIQLKHQQIKKVVLPIKGKKIYESSGH